MMTTLITPSDLDADTRGRDLELLWADPDWVDAEFFAILRAS